MNTFNFRRARCTALPSLYALPICDSELGLYKFELEFEFEFACVLSELVPDPPFVAAMQMEISVLC